MSGILSEILPNYFDETGVKYQDLAYHLDVSISTLARKFQEMLDIIAIRLDFLIFWPEHEELQKTMPLCFHPTYGLKVVAIIDCYEIKI